ncbi:MAG: hypothetical protein Q9214_006108 [Letrouitia sp. 1 TL-2023]
MHGYNGIYWGWAPDDRAGTKMTTINGDTGKKASTYGRYSQISELPYTGDQLLGAMSDVVASGAVFVPAIMPTGIKFSQITPAVAQQIATVLNKFTSQGVEVWLRFAHEVNYYTTKNSGGANGGPLYPGGNPTAHAEFKTAWQIMHAAVASNPKILMFWSPNQNTTSEPIDGWWPGANYVDIVGIDVYPDPGATFASAYGEFYDAYARRYNKHFCIGETGANHGGSVAAKEAWVKQLANTDVSAYPCYKSATWFEYHKGVDFRIVQGQSADTIRQTLSNFA